MDSCPGCNFMYEEKSRGNLTLELQQIKSCEGINEDGCKFFFTSTLLAKDELAVFLLLTEEGEKEVCQSVNTMAITLGLFLALILIGIAILAIWKCCRVIYDRRIYAKFERERARQIATNQNALYQSPITTYENPMHGKAFN